MRFVLATLLVAIMTSANAHGCPCGKPGCAESWDATAFDTCATAVIGGEEEVCRRARQCAAKSTPSISRLWIGGIRCS